ncbi:MAG: hypothetical protein WBB01_18645, partial [Phormidesmis sp.]
IIEGLGGKIWATSAGKNQGTQIHFTLPAVDTPRYSKGKRLPRKSTGTPAKATSADKTEASQSQPATKPAKSRTS